MFQTEITEKTLGEIRSFLDELSNGTSRYKSLHNLTEQVEHQYHGRFLIELIQNAHDALFERETIGDKRRIEILMADEKPFGTLYIANDGRPFTPSNFQALSNLGQSDKDPQESIGNKGIGFRSVLEISRAPEIYSRSEPGSMRFDGFCFRFHPDITHRFEEPIRQLLKGENSPKYPLPSEKDLIQWDLERLESFRNKYSTRSKKWLSEELSFLSPYALPIPILSDNFPDPLNAFERRGFATVVRLPIINESARKLVLEKLDGFDQISALFLERLNSLRLVCGKDEKHYLRDQHRRADDPEGGYEVLLIAKDPQSNNKGTLLSQQYWMWQRTIGGDSDPQGTEKVAEAVAKLPGKWPQVREATVSFAVLISDKAEEGILNIYLPTDIPIGCSTHFSGPFYGDMSRTKVDFEKAFNELLIEAIAEKIIDVVFRSLAGKGHKEAATIIDLIAPTPNEDGKRWWKVLKKIFENRSITIQKENICLTDTGWNCLAETSLLPTIDESRVIDQELLRSKAQYPVFVQSLANHEEQIQQIFNAVEVGSLSTDEDLGRTIEAIASWLKGKPEFFDWTGFWEDVKDLFSNKTEPLKGRKIILGTDNKLHKSDDISSVFFRPRSGGSDDEVVSLGAVEYIPDKLQPFLAFLHDSIKVHVPGQKGGIQTTSVHAYLSSGLVQSFGVEQILRSVLVANTPELPVFPESRNNGLCKDIIQWALRLLLNSRDNRDRTLTLLGRLPAPCIGGWYPLDQTCFGPGWPGTTGDNLKEYLESIDTPECQEAIKKMLLPPNHPYWGGAAEASRELIEKAGVFDGLRPMGVDQNDWGSKFNIARRAGVKLPETPPPCFGKRIWEEYREYINTELSPYFDGEFTYGIQGVFSLPGLDQFDNFSYITKEALMRVLMASIPSWADPWKWNEIVFKKIRGASHRFNPISPLKFALQELPWLIGNGVSFRPRDRWYIPSPTLLGGIHQFIHLKPVPARISSIFDSNPVLVNILKSLGMPKYEPDPDIKRDDSRFLDDLATALNNPMIEISNMSVFLGQVRLAWGQFDPSRDEAFPKRIIIQNGKSSLTAIEPSEQNQVFLPNSNVALHERLELHAKPMIAMEIRDAKRLEAMFRETFSNGVLFASELTVKALINGEPWSQEVGASSLSVDIPWLPAVIMTVFAFLPGQSRGTGTKRFREGMDQLRKACTFWADDLEAGIWRDEECIARTNIDAMWFSKVSTLIAVHEAIGMPGKLSEALSALVDRSDLDIPLKLVLGKFQGDQEPSHDEIVSALNQLHISRDRYDEVLQKWLGDLSWTVRLINPLILVFNPEADLSILSEVSNEESLKILLNYFDLSPLNTNEALELARESKSMEALGRKLHDLIGERAQLDKWNQVLSYLGESEILNEQAIDEFEGHLDAARKPLRSIIRDLLLSNLNHDNFLDLDEKLSELERPADFQKCYWFVPFEAVMSLVSELFKNLGSRQEILVALTSATDTKDLVSLLGNLGLEPNIDPLEIHADNHKKLSFILGEIRKTIIAWCLKNKIDIGIWGKDTSSIKTQLSVTLKKEAFLSFWDENMCLRIIGQINRHHIHKDFWDSFDSANSLKDLFHELDIIPEYLNDAEERLERYKHDQERKKNTTNVCGEDFINTRENLPNLWEHIIHEIDNKKMPDINLDIAEELKELPQNAKRKPVSKKGKKGSKSGGRISQALKNLIGLAGEIHAYRSLEKTFGSDLIGPSCWKSENSLYRFPENSVNDGLGCDFIIHDGKRKHFIEVKATQGEDESIELGSSEVEIAIDKAGKRREVFKILHIVNALSERPVFRMLPNPYDKRFKKNFRFEDAGLRIRYKI